jgi:hypothetical protein
LRAIDQLTLFLPFATVTGAINTSLSFELTYEFSPLDPVRL